MKVCISEFIYNESGSFFDQLLSEHEILLIDSNGLLSQGEGKPQVTFVSYDVMAKCIRNPEYSKNFLPSMQGCDFIQGSWAGVESEVAQKLIKYSNNFSYAGGVHVIPIASYVFAQMLRWVKGLDQHNKQQHDLLWKPLLLTGELTDLTIGITGFGGIGKEIARLAKAFRMTVYATKRTNTESADLDKLYDPSEINEMLKLSDFIVNCLPDSPETNKIFSKDKFKLMKPSSMFINVGRGESVNEEDLAQALIKGQIAAASIDVTYPEPLSKESPLWKIDNCYITPHDSAWAPKGSQRLLDLFANNFKRYLEDKDLLNLA
jgi:phosphoglycerate dehydrogenase-like enzyme